MAGSNKQGFASMDEEQRKEIARKGGQASSSRQGEQGDQGGNQNPGNFANDPEKASEAGRKGGQASKRGASDEYDMEDDLLG